LAHSVDLKIWTVIDGLRDGLVADQPPIPETQHPAAALFFLKRQDKKTITVMLDLVPHLKDERTLRAARELVSYYSGSGSTLLVIDYLDEMPPVLSCDAARFELSLPKETEIDELVKKTLRQWNYDGGIAIDIKKSAYEAIIRNLSGLSRR